MSAPPPSLTPAAHAARVVLAAFLAFAGTGHLTFARTTFRAQVPSWVPADPDVVVLASGVVELLLAAGLLLAPGRGARARGRPPVRARLSDRAEAVDERAVAGWATAAFFVAVFPGNVAQFVERRDAFGLDSDVSRGVRLAFQPLLVVWALWCTGAWRALRRRRRS